MIIRVSFMVVASFAALKISQTKTTSHHIKRNGSMKSSGCDESHLDHELEEMENRTANADQVMQNEEKHAKSEMPQNLLCEDFEKMDDATEKELLQNLVQSYKQREVNLERKLLELNGLKEEKLAIVELQKQFRKKSEKLDSLKMTIASLQAENKSISEKVREDVMSKKKLDIAKKMVNEMQRKRDVNGGHVEEQILMLQQQVTELEKYNSSARYAMVNKKLEDVQGVELEVLELKRRNKELELEKREMGVKLATANIKVRTEEETVCKIKEEVTDLRHVHEELLEQVERLQRNRFEMVEELVYQRWLYTILRFEVINHKKIREIPRQYFIQNNSSKEEMYEKKAHSFTHDPEIDSSNSSNTTLDESDETETTTTLESSSSSSQSSSSSSSSKKSSLLSKMKRWRKTKHDSKEFSSKGRRNSMPMVPFDQPTQRNSDISVITLSKKISSSNSLEKPMMTRLKRVSFSDSVKSSDHQDVSSEAVEEEIEDDDDNEEETRPGKIMELPSSNVSWDENEEAEQCVKHSNSNESLVGDPSKDDDTNVDEKEGSNNKIGDLDELYSRHELVCRKGDRIKIQLVQLVVLFFFSLILLAYFRIK